MIHKSFMTVLLSSLLLVAITGPMAARSAQAAPASTIVVDDGSDVAVCSGFLTLRCAIVAANATPFTNIRFAPGLPAVLLNSPLPTITGNGTWIDGHDISNSCVCPRLDGATWSGATGNALTINANDVTISNINIVGIPLGGADISIVGGHDATIANDALGILPGATSCGNDTNYGVSLTNNTGTSSAGGGVAYIYASTLSCHAQMGVYDDNANYVYIGEDRLGNIVGNNIGLTTDGLHSAGNAEAGVDVFGSQASNVVVRSNQIAGNGTAGVYLAAGSGNEIVNNTISGNGGPGLWIDGGDSHSIISNHIGTSSDGLTAVPNGDAGIRLSGGTGLFLSSNVVANNPGAGIAVTGNATRALIEDNHITNNGGLPIDLGDDGATPNGEFSSPGPDNWLAYPVVTGASGNLLQGTACDGCAVYLFRAVGNPGQPRGGGVFLLNTFASSFGTWSFTLPAGVTVADISLLALDPTSGSSEMSPRPQLLLPLISR